MVSLIPSKISCIFSKILDCLQNAIIRFCKQSGDIRKGLPIKYKIKNKHVNVQIPIVLLIIFLPAITYRSCEGQTNIPTLPSGSLCRLSLQCFPEFNIIMPDRIGNRYCWKYRELHLDVTGHLSKLNCHCWISEGSRREDRRIKCTYMCFYFYVRLILP